MAEWALVESERGAIPVHEPPAAAVTELTRISHHLATANRDLPQSAAFPPIGLLNILHSMPPLPSSRKYHISRHLSVLATQRGEICGLTGALMSLSRSVSEILRDHISLEIEGIDRLYLNRYVPILQRPAGWGRA